MDDADIAPPEPLVSTRALWWAAEANLADDVVEEKEEEEEQEEEEVGVVEVSVESRYSVMAINSFRFGETMVGRRSGGEK